MSHLDQGGSVIVIGGGARQSEAIGGVLPIFVASAHSVDEKAARYQGGLDASDAWLSCAGPGELAPEVGFLPGLT
jgi:hypothetical protein